MEEGFECPVRLAASLCRRRHQSRCDGAVGAAVSDWYVGSLFLHIVTTRGAPIFTPDDDHRLCAVTNRFGTLNHRYAGLAPYHVPAAVGHASREAAGTSHKACDPQLCSQKVYW